jgi:hypothetical protein
LSSWTEPSPSPPVTPWREPVRPRTDLTKLPPANRPVDCSDEEYARRLWAETDRSLRQDPSRWVIPSAGDFSYSTAARAGDPQESGLRAYVQDPVDRHAAQAELYREKARRERATREQDLTASALKGWETRRANAARAQAQAPTQDPVPQPRSVVVRFFCEEVGEAEHHADGERGSGVMTRSSFV